MGFVPKKMVMFACASILSVLCFADVSARPFGDCDHCKKKDAPNPEVQKMAQLTTKEASCGKKKNTTIIATKSMSFAAFLTQLQDRENIV